MYLYKLPEQNQYLFVRKRSLYNLYAPGDLNSLLLIPEKFYRKYEKHYGTIEKSKFNDTATELLKTHFVRIFNQNQLNSVHKKLIGFFINQFEISREQYAQALQKILTEHSSFDLQVELAKYKSIKGYSPFFSRILKSIR